MRFRLLILSLFFTAVTVLAQEKSPLLSEAENAYSGGRFETVISLLEGGAADAFPEKDKIQAYRILTLSCLYLDLPEDAETYAGKILSVDPFYTPYGDPPRFSDMIAKLKKGQSTITTASKLAESVEEVPVPVTLITEEMIRASGAMSLQDVLLQYVPGLSSISSLEDNVAMRGIYGLSQEGILVMLDGHRLNSLTTNGEPFDFRNNIDKIKQVEVLRGPASSLYGNVTLTAVVNIITKSGTDIEGGQVSAVAGNHGKAGGSLMFGNGNLKFDYLVWASAYYSHGEQVSEDKLKGPHYVGAYNSKPTYDLGAKIRWGDLKIEVTGRHAHPIPVFSILDVTGVYDYYKYGTVNGDGPGMSRTDLRADVDWSHRWNKFTLSATGHASSERQQIYNTLGDTISSHVLTILGSMIPGASFKDTVGTRQVINWESYGFGAGLSGSYDYSFRKGMSGSLIAGLQYESLIMSGNGNLMLGGSFVNTNYTRHDIIPRGSEHTISTYLQLKHYFTRKLIFNGGVRFDHKIRLDGRQIFTCSPRLSLIWLPTSLLTVKGGYSHAFVDAAPFYRASTISLFSGGTELDPEKMDSFQAGAILNWKHQGLKYEFNCFYNNVQDLVYYNLGELFSGEGKKAVTFKNAGHVTVGGVENVFQLNKERLLLNFNCTYQYCFKVESFNSKDNSISNVPAFLLNATAQYAVWKGVSGSSLNLRGSVHFQTGFDCLTNSLVTKFYDPEATITYWQPDYTLLNAGAEWRWSKGLNISFDVRNILNEQYHIGGQLLQGFPGESVNFVVRVSYRFGQKK